MNDQQGTGQGAGGDQLARLKDELNKLKSNESLNNDSVNSYQQIDQAQNLELGDNTSADNLDQDKNTVNTPENQQVNSNINISSSLPENNNGNYVMGGNNKVVVLGMALFVLSTITLAAYLVGGLKLNPKDLLALFGKRQPTPTPAIIPTLTPVPTVSTMEIPLGNVYVDENYGFRITLPEGWENSVSAIEFNSKVGKLNKVTVATFTKNTSNLKVYFEGGGILENENCTLADVSNSVLSGKVSEKRVYNCPGIKVTSFEIKSYHDFSIFTRYTEELEMEVMSMVESIVFPSEVNPSALPVSSPDTESRFQQ